MAESSAHFHWRNAPRSTFENFRDYAVTLMEAVAFTYSESDRLTGKGIGSPLTLQYLFQDAKWVQTALDQQLPMAREIWDETPVKRHLILTYPIQLGPNGGCRYDGCCCHEVAMRLADGLALAVKEQATFASYCAHLEMTIGRTDLNNYLQSFAAKIQCEAELGFQRWKAEQANEGQQSAQQIENSANEKNRSKLFPEGQPDDPNIIDLVVRLDSAKGTGRKQLDIAREFTGESVGNDDRAKKLMARIRMMRNRGQLNL